jgi:hypothetical protein
MPNHQSLKAKLQPLIQQAPELFFIAFGNQSNLRQIDRYNTLVDI